MFKWKLEWFKIIAIEKGKRGDTVYLARIFFTQSKMNKIIFIFDITNNYTNYELTI